MRPSILKLLTPAASRSGRTATAARSRADMTRDGSSCAASGRPRAYRSRHDWLQRPRLPLRPPTMLLSRQSPEYP
ncbi:MAG: hypothetical protein BWY94_01943 [Actinobacteria bacterium ADurb.BinA094]|nr:MAG: hypothetical protein BWY94_01943 [Actinobacteria bacterium ADurb.BinA094]